MLGEDDRPVYGIVLRDNTLEVAVDQGRPAEYRSQIAGAAGIPSRFMRFSPAVPCVRDAAFDGTKCRAVLAVCDTRDPSLVQAAILDLRALLLGWRIFAIRNGFVSRRAIFEDLQDYGPPGWEAYLLGDPVQDDLLQADPGQVFIVGLRRVTQGDVAAREGVGAQDPLGHPHDPEAAPQPGSNFTARPSGDRTATGEHPSHGASPAPSGSSADGHVRVREAEPVRGLGAVFQSFCGVFLVFGQDYQAERLQLRIRLGCPVDEVLQLLHARRAVQPAACLPRLVVVNPQPCVDHALILGMPLWPCDGAVVAVDCRQVNGACFAVQIGKRVTRQGLLIVAKLDTVPDLEVFVRDLPWPLLTGVVASLEHGDLVLVRRREAPAHTVASLHDMLGSVAGWDPNYQVPRCPHETAWILGPTSSHRLEALPGLRLEVSDVAAITNVSRDALVLRPARPAISNFDHRGHAVDNVVIASSTAEPRLGDYPGCPACFVDLRPMLLQLDWNPCPEGVLHTADLLARLRNRCPLGFELGLVHNGVILAPVGPWIQVADRETLVFTFFYPDPDTRLRMPDSDDGPSRPSNNRRNDSLDPESSSHPGQSSSTRPDAGTGGTAFLPRSSMRYARHALYHTPSRVTGARHFIHDVQGVSALTLRLMTFFRERAFCVCYAVLLCLLGALVWEPVALRIFWLGSALYLRNRPALVFLGVISLCVVSVSGTCAGPAGTGAPAAYPTLRGAVRPALGGRSLLAPGCVSTLRHRPVPTPTRSMLAGRSITRGDDSDLIQTLLQESVQRADCHAYLEAATLLEALSEHFEVRRNHAVVPFQVGRPRAIPGGQVVLLNEGCVDACQEHPRALPTSRVGFPRFSIPLHRPLRIGHTGLGFNAADLLQLFCGPSAICSWAAALRTVPGLRVFGPRISAFARSLAEIASPDIWCFTGGSYFPRNSGSAEKLGWAALFLQPDTFACGWAAGCVDTDTFGKPGQLSAYVSECVALGAAQLISAVELTHAVVHFRSDCQAALAAVAGQIQGTPAKCAMFAINARTLRAQLTGGRDTYEYVAGHSGILGNEIADLLSKFGAKAKQLSHGPVRAEGALAFWLRAGGDLLSWGGLAAQSLLGRPAAPPLCVDDLGQETDHAGLAPSDLIRPFVPRGLCAEKDGDTSTAGEKHIAYSLDVCTASFNALSLLPPKAVGAPAALSEAGLAFQTGAAAILERQLHAHGVVLACLQETRCPEGTLKTGRYVRLCSGGQRGQWGTEVWILDGHRALKSADGRSWPISAARATVLHHDPRRILVRLPCGPLSFLVAALHGPHRAFEATQIADWWHETGRLVRHHNRGDFVVLAGDFNAAVGSRPTEAFGDLHPEVEDCAGEQAQQIAWEYRLFAPNTFSDFHTGESFTYHQKKSSKVLRTDYILLPRSWRAGTIASYTVPKIHAGHASQDHVATCVDVSLELVRPDAGLAPKGHGIRASDVCAPENQSAVRQLLHSAPVVPWHVSAHAHAAIVTRHVQQGLRMLAPAKHARPKHLFLQAETWQLQQQLAKIRHVLQARRRMLNRHRLLAAFEVWRHPTATFESRFLGNMWVLRTLATQAVQAQHMSAVSRTLKAACKADRDRYICRLADEVASGPANSVFASLHKLLSHKRKRPYHLEPLPALNKPDGSQCTDYLDVLATWRQHFGGLEGGQETSFQDLAARAFLGRQCPELHPAMPHPDTLSDVASPSQMLLVLRATKTGKAAGLDGMPPELCRFFATELTPVLFPLFLKTAWRGQEPAGWKGGSSVYFHKHRGRFDECSSYRAVLLLSTWAKQSLSQMPQGTS